jgi:hypothetical protein
MSNRQRYLSYLLRLWQTSDDGEQIWRASLEAPGTGERRGFGSVADLFDFLQDQIESEGEGSDDPGVTGVTWDT